MYSVFIDNYFGLQIFTFFRCSDFFSLPLTMCHDMLWWQIWAWCLVFLLFKISHTHCSGYDSTSTCSLSSVTNWNVSLNVKGGHFLLSGCGAEVMSVNDHMNVFSAGLWWDRKSGTAPSLCVEVTTTLSLMNNVWFPTSKDCNGPFCSL